MRMLITHLHVDGVPDVGVGVRNRVHGVYEEHAERVADDPEEHSAGRDLADPWELRLATGRDAIVRDSEHGEVVEQREEDYQNRIHRAGGDVDQGRQAQNEEDGRCDAVDYVGLDLAEDLAAADDRPKDGAETGVGQNDRGCRLGGVRRPLDGDPDLGCRESRSVVHPVPGHAHDEALVVAE